MKARHEKFPKKGGNPHDQTGRAASGVCPKCAEPMTLKPGFRVASLTCAKCGAPMKNGHSS